MASGYKSAGVDFDDLFDPDIVGDGPTAPSILVGGVAMKYAKLSYGTKRADVGRKVGGVDVSNLWAAKGTASYFPSGVGAVSNTFSGAARAANMQIAIRTNGTIAVTGTGTTSTTGFGTTTYSASSAAFDFRISGNVTGLKNSSATAPTLAGKGGVSFAGTSPTGNSATFDTGWQASADDAASFLNFTTSTPGNGGLSHLSGDLTIQIRRKSDSVIVQSMLATFEVYSDSQS